jgi:hypothetical protein
MSDSLKSEQTLEEEALKRDLQTLASHSCFECQQELCLHEILCSIVMGYKKTPLCLHCLAKENEQELLLLQERLLLHIQRRPCWRTAWNFCEEQEQELQKPCHWNFKEKR